MQLRSTIGSLYRRLTGQTPLIEIRISKSALLHNLTTYKAAYPEVQFAPVLKSNAYGHGLTLIARLLDNEDIAFFMVDSLYEARQLRRNGVKTRVVVMGYVRPEQIATSTLRDVDFAIVDIEQLRALTRAATRPLRVHIKLDTGMHRLGLPQSELLPAIQLIRANPNLEVVGVASHLADADNTDERYTREQLSAWKAMEEDVLRAFPSIEYRHLAATKGARYSKEADANVVRLGAGLYGIDTSPATALPLRPVLSMRSLIASIRTVAEGDWVGYNATYHAQTPRRIATVPAGYFEGIERALSNKGAFMVGKVACPIVGRISMNMSSIDVTDVPSASAGDEVELLGDRNDGPNSARVMAELAGTTPYVILSHLPSHLLRVVGK